MGSLMLLPSSQETKWELGTEMAGTLIKVHCGVSYALVPIPSPRVRPSGTLSKCTKLHRPSHDSQLL